MRIQRPTNSAAHYGTVNDKDTATMRAKRCEQANEVAMLF